MNYYNYTKEEINILKDRSISNLKAAKMLDRSEKGIEQKRLRMSAARRLVRKLDLIRDVGA